MKYTSTQRIELLWSRIDTSGDCWAWNGAHSPDGYSRIYFNGKTWMGHRLTYTLVYGSIPEGLQADHLCRNRWCVRPSHIEPVTPKVNQERTIRKFSQYCPQGHLYDANNTYRNPNSGKRQCRACRQIHKKKSRLRARGKNG